MYSVRNTLRKAHSTYLLLRLRPSTQSALCQKKYEKKIDHISFQLSSKEFHTSIKYKIFSKLNFKSIDIWYSLEKIKHEWDPDFNAKKFEQGANQALYTIVNLIQENCWLDLRGLIIRPLVESLQRDQELLKKINDSQLTEELISSNISRVATQEIVDKKYCDIDVTFELAKGDDAKRPTHNFILRFHREYTQGKLPEWTITKILLEAKETN